MKNDYAGLLKSKLIELIIGLVVGIFFIIWPNTVLTTMNKMIAIVCILIAAVGILAFIAAIKGGSMVIGDVLTFVIGVIFLVLGITMLINSDTFVSLLGMLFGFVLLVHGVIGVAEALIYLRHMDPLWWVSLVLPIITIILSIVALISPFDAVATLVRFIGIALVYASAVALVAFVRILLRRHAD